MSAPWLTLGWVVLQVPIDIGRAEARQRAAAELQKSKYGGMPDWLERFLEWLFALADRLANPDVSMTGNPGQNLVVLITGAILLLGLAFIIWRVGLPRWRQRGKHGTVDIDSTVAPQDYRSLAEQAAAAQDWAAAVRDRFRAVVRELEDRTILDVRPSRTALEVAHTASRWLPSAREHLDDGADLFNDVVYGERPATAAAYAAMVVVDEAVVAASDHADLDEVEDADPVVAGTPGSTQ
ncbi:MAG: DUF4129 domain-containing protein [Propionibacteriaceae bacterium]